MKEGELYADGLTLNFYNSADFEPKNVLNSAHNQVIQAHNLFRVLMMAWNPAWSAPSLL